MNLTTRQVIEKYGITKTTADHLIRKWGKSWGLEKDPAGFWIWPPAAIKALETHLERKPATIEQVPAGIPAEEKAIVLAIADGMGKRLDKIQAAMVTQEQITHLLERALSKQAENYQGKIDELKRELTVIKNSLPPTHGDRRHEPATFWEVCYRYFCLAPVVERRR